MKVLVFGAGGKTGGMVVTRALEKKHEVTVLVRDASKFMQAGVRILAGDATNREDVLTAMQGQDAVIDAIGGTTPYKDTDLESTAVGNIIEAMRSEGARRLIVVSMMGIGDSEAQAPFWYKHLLMPTFLRGATKDKTEMEAETSGSGLDFVIVRPPILKDDPATGRVTVLGSEATGHQITRGDLANFLVDQLDGNAYLGRAITVVNS